MWYLNHYTMDDQLKVAKWATWDITPFLQLLPDYVDLINVEDVAEYRKKDIDLIWKYSRFGKVLTKYVEIKGDTQHRTGNYFLETISNMNTQSPGCFIYSEADYFFYYFVHTKILHVIPLKQAREWFFKNKDSFKERCLWTNGYNDKELYQTKGSLVPIKRLNSEVKGVKTINLTPYLIEKAS